MTDEQAIESSIRKFIKAYNAGDLKAVLAYYSDDLIKTRQGAAPETKTETTQRIADAFDRFECSVDVSNEEIQVVDDFAFTRGSFKVVLKLKNGGDAQTLHRRYLEIWRKEGAEWRVFRTMDNTA